MISQRTQLPIVAFSVRVYQALLVAYPTKFQQEYGSQMVQVFQDCCLRALRQGGTNGMLKLWAVTLFDLVQSVISEYRQKEVQMKKEMKPEDVRMAGWALMAGAVIFILSIIREQPIGTILSMMLFFGGMLGLRSQYGEKVGSFAKNILLIGAVLGVVTSIVGLVGARVDNLWILIYTGPAMLFACLALFGVVALYKKPLSRWNVLPLIAGIWYPAFFFQSVIKSINTKGQGDPTNNVTMALVLLQCIALFILGYILKSDVPEETAANA